MLDKNKSITVAALLGILTMFAASPAQAGWDRDNDRHYRGHRYRHHHHHRYCRHRPYRHHGHHGSSYGKLVLTLPGNYVRIIVGGKRYYRSDGGYYRRSGHYYESVPSPYGGSRDHRYDD